MTDTSKLFYKDISSPVGLIRLVATDTGLSGLLWEGEGYKRVKFPEPERNDFAPVLLETQRQLEEYFKKKRTTFDLPIDLKGSSFQLKIWQALLKVSFGTTKTYGDLAHLIGDFKAVRAVGGALNKNPISIIIPCHRIVGASGKLGGFAGGSENKLILLELENTKRVPDLFSQ